MKDLQSFLKPKRKPNLKIVVSPAFVDETGKPIEWEMRQLSSREGVDIGGEVYREIMCNYVAESLVFPNLHDNELLKGLSEREGHKILKAKDALLALVNDSELAVLIEAYIKYNELTMDFNALVDEAKN